MDRCRVWESHAELAERNVEQLIRTYPAYTVKPMEREPDGVRAVAGDIPAASVDHSSMMLKKLVDMLAPGANMPRKATEPSALDKLVRLLRGHVVDKNPVVPVPPVLPSWNTRLKILSGSGSDA